MRKLILSLLAVASLFGAIVSTANAQVSIGIQPPVGPPIGIVVPLPKVCIGSLCA
jgi:hypothetical protein